MALERAGGRDVECCRRGSRWRRRRRSGRRPGHGCTSRAWRGCPRRHRRSRSCRHRFASPRSSPGGSVYRPVGLNLSRSRAGRRTWGGRHTPWNRNGRHCRCPTRSRSRTGLPKERYYDPDFYELEAEQLWSRAWQMACRLEEIPEPRRLRPPTRSSTSRSSCVRADDGEVRAFQNACRHRGVRLVEGPGNGESGFTCPFHGWCYGPDGANTRIPMRKSFDRAQPAERRHRSDPGALRAVGRVRVDQPRRRRAAAAAVPRAGRHDSRRVEGRIAARPSGGTRAGCRSTGSSRSRRSRSCTTWSQTHPQLVIPGMRYGARRVMRSTRRCSSTPRSNTCARCARAWPGWFTPTTCASPRACATSNCRPTRSWRWRRGTARSTSRSSPGTAPRGTTSPTSRSSKRAASTSRWATASRTTSCCPCTAARRRTGSALWDRRRR